MPHSPTPLHASLHAFAEKCAQHKLKAFVVSNAEIQYPTPFEFEEYVLVPLPGQVTVEHCFSNNEQLRGTAGLRPPLKAARRYYCPCQRGIEGRWSGNSRGLEAKIGHRRHLRAPGILDDPASWKGLMAPGVGWGSHALHALRCRGGGGHYSVQTRSV